MDKDAEHLRLLALFHYVVAGIGALFSLIPVIHLVIGIFIVTGRFPDAPDDRFPVAFGWLFIIMAVAFILCGLAFSICLAIAGRFLSCRKHYVYCLVMAALACALMPFGTVLGVFTIIVLQRDSVKRLFERPLSAPPVAGP